MTDRTRESGSKFFAEQSGKAERKVQGSKVEVRTVRDTVYIEKRDSSLRVSSLGASCAPQVLRRASSESGLQEDPSARSGQATGSSKLSAVSKVLKWIFFIIIGLIGLIVTVKVCTLKR